MFFLIFIVFNMQLAFLSFSGFPFIEFLLLGGLSHKNAWINIFTLYFTWWFVIVCYCN